MSSVEGDEVLIGKFFYIRNIFCVREWLEWGINFFFFEIIENRFYFLLFLVSIKLDY